MDIAVLNQIMDESLEELSDVKSKVTKCISAYELFCIKLIDEIASGTRDEAEDKFNLLFDVQGKLSKAVFLHGIDIGENLTNVVRQFERLHDSHSRDFWFKKIKAGERWPLA